MGAIEKAGLGAEALHRFQSEKGTVNRRAVTVHKWLGSRGVKISRSSVIRWLQGRSGARASEIGKVIPASVAKIVPAELEVRDETHRMLIEATRSAVGGPDFVAMAERLAADMRAIYEDQTAHPQLRSRAADVAKEIIIEGHEMSADRLVLEMGRRS